MTNYLLIGTLLGLSAGISPGPLLTLVISETLRHDIRSGISVALAPVISDLPIILLTFLVLSKLSGFKGILGVISLTGACFILYMGWESIRTKGIDLDLQPQQQPKSLAKGVLVNILNPHPYLFWFSVGAPTMTRAMVNGIASVLAFLFGFYFMLVGSKILLAVLVGKSKHFLSGKVYLYTMRFLGLALCLLALALFLDGLKLLALQ